MCIDLNDGSGTCTGDSGAGLALSRSVGFEKYYYLVGIVSISKATLTGCGLSFYTLSTNVQDYIEFISNATNNYPPLQ